VDLADGGGGVGCFVHFGEEVLDAVPEFAFDLVLDDLVIHGRRLFLEALQGVGEFPGQEVLGLGGDLAHFHDGTLELPRVSTISSAMRL